MRDLYRRGDVVWVELPAEATGSEIACSRPWLIISNDTGNRHGPTVIAAALTTRPPRSNLPTHVSLGVVGNLDRESTAQLEQIRTIDKMRIVKVRGSISEEKMKVIDQALRVSLGLGKAQKSMEKEDGE